MGGTAETQLTFVKGKTNTRLSRVIQKMTLLTNLVVCKQVLLLNFLSKTIIQKIGATFTIPLYMCVTLKIEFISS